MKTDKIFTHVCKTLPTQLNSVTLQLYLKRQQKYTWITFMENSLNLPVLDFFKINSVYVFILIGKLLKTCTSTIRAKHRMMKETSTCNCSIVQLKLTSGCDPESLF